MLKVRIFKILTPVLILSIIAFLIVANLYNRPKIYSELLGEQSVCNLVSFDVFENERCYRNAMIIMYKGYSKQSMEILEDLCSNGYGVACFARDQYYNLGNSVGNSYKYGSFRNSLNFCLIHPVENDYDGYYCRSLSSSAYLIKDKSTSRMIECKKDQSKCTKSSPEDMIYSLEFKKLLFKKFCTDKTANSSGFCLGLKDYISIEPLEDDNTKKTKIFGSRLTSFCSENKEMCLDVINKASVLNAIFRNVNLANLFPVEHLTRESSQSLSFAFQSMPDEWITNLKNPYLKFFSLSVKGSYQKIKEICDSSIDKAGCVLMFPTLKEIEKNFDDVKKLCQKGDSVACDMKLMSESSMLDLAAKDTKTTYIFRNKEYFVLENIITHPTFKIRTFLNVYKYHFMAVVLIIMFSIQLYVIILYKRSDDTFDYLKKHQSDKIKKKLKNLSDD